MTVSDSGRRRFEEDVREIREFLGFAEDRDVHRQAPGREAILVELADSAEIGCAEERHPIVLVPVKLAVAGLLEAETGEPRIVGEPASGRIGGHVEIGVVVDDLARLPLFHHVHPRGLLEIPPKMEECNGELARAVGPQGQVGLELDLAVGVVIDLLENFRRWARRRHIGHRCHVPRLLFQTLVRKRRWLAHLQSLLGEGRGGESRSGETRGGGGELEELAAIEHEWHLLLEKPHPTKVAGLSHSYPLEKSTSAVKLTPHTGAVTKRLQSGS